MQVKIDTKEIFHVITLPESAFHANMTEELGSILLTYLQKPIKNIVLSLKDIQFLDEAAAETLIGIQQKFYEQGASFVISGLQPVVEQRLDSAGWLELMNAVPTESEAGDIVQMEEIERELLEE
ncbi:MAG: STAS domain-containing protein [Chitinophagaceae bacterium]